MICEGCAHFDREITEYLRDDCANHETLRVLCRFSQTDEGGADMYPDFYGEYEFNGEVPETCEHYQKKEAGE